MDERTGLGVTASVVAASATMMFGRVMLLTSILWSASVESVQSWFAILTVICLCVDMLVTCCGRNKWSLSLELK